MDSLSIGQVSIPLITEQRPGRRIRIWFPEGGNTLHIATPDGRIDSVCREFLKSKSNWILKHYLRACEILEKRRHFLSRIHEEVLFLGEYLPVYKVPARTRRIQKTPTGLELQLNAEDMKRELKPVLYAGLRALARPYLRRKVSEWQQKTGESVGTLRIKNHKSKWGSCSTARNINLNWHLIFLREELIDYVIVHELMHLKEMNHSPAFWNWVEKYYPEYKSARKEIRDKQWLIGIFDS